ncbi:MAG: alpha-amylase family glycosyl hydrolase [Candidatus Thermochlorobacter sp.]
MPYLRDLLPELTLIAGKTDSVLISDLFYAERYDAAFETNPHIQVRYDTATKWLVLTAQADFEGYTLLAFRHGTAIYRFPVKVKRLTEHTFRYVPKGQVKQVCVMGNFNDWNRTSLPMQQEPDGSFTLTRPFDEGEYQYKFVVDGEEVIDEGNLRKVPNGFGGYNSVLTIKPRRTNNAYLHIASMKRKGDETELAFVFECDSAASKLRSQHVIALIDNQLLGARQLTIVENRIVVRLKGYDMVGEKVLRLAVSQEGVTTPMQTFFLFNGLPMGAPESSRIRTSNLARETAQQPFNWRDAIIYSIITDRFANGDSTNDKPLVHDSLLAPANYFGGDFRGIIQKLDEGYFDSLGVNVLWLSPVNKHPERPHPGPGRSRPVLRS